MHSSVSKPVVQYFMVLHVTWYCTRDTLERYVPGMYVPSLVQVYKYLDLE